MGAEPQATLQGVSLHMFDTRRGDVGPTFHQMEDPEVSFPFHVLA